MFQRTLLIAAIPGILAGCALPATTSAPTPYPANYIPTLVYLTAESINAATAFAPIPPTEMATATITPVPSMRVPTTAPAAGPGVPLAAIQVKEPGPMSRVVSPLEVQMLAIAGDSRKIEVDLFGEDGRLLGRTLKAVAGSPAGDSLSVEIRFETRAAGENGFVQVSTRGTKYAQSMPQSLVTVPILLRSAGASQINPAGNTIYDRVTLDRLPPESTVSGGVFAVEGEMMPYNRQQVILELISDEGRILCQRLLPFSGSDWQPFSTTVPYKVRAPTRARLYIHQAHDVLDGQAYIFSQEITLNP